MTDLRVGVIVTIVALICTIILVSFQRWVVRRTQSQAVRADMLHYQSDVMMNGAILAGAGVVLVRLASRRCSVCIGNRHLYFI